MPLSTRLLNLLPKQLSTLRNVDSSLRLPGKMLNEKKTYEGHRSVTVVKRFLLNGGLVEPDVTLHEKIARHGMASTLRLIL